MAILGTALLALCYLLGLAVGEFLGRWLGIDANVGGVGFAMIFLLLARGQLEKRDLMPPSVTIGVTFWAALYIPVVIAMAASQNVIVAIKSGPVALLAAIGSVVLCALVIAAINRTRFARPSADWVASRPGEQERAP